MTKKFKVKIDVENSEKKTIKNSIIGKLLYEGKQCPNCHAIVLSHWKTCIRCNKPLSKQLTEYKKPKTVCYNCGNPVSMDMEICPKCGGTKAIVVE